MIPVYNPTVTEKKAALEHVHYEINQFVDTNYSSRPGVSTWWGKGNELDNAMLESCLLHARALLHFFETKALDRPHDDVLAEDYGFPARDVGVEAIYKTRLNKDLAHITYSRVSRGSLRKEWPPDKILPPILARSQEFVEHLLGNYLQANRPQTIPYWEDLLSKIKE